MNNRIKELEDLAYEFALAKSKSEGWDYPREDYFNQKFAELIIRECAGLFDDHNSPVTDYTNGRGCPTIIKEHFGIK